MCLCLYLSLVPSFDDRVHVPACVFTVYTCRNAAVCILTSLQQTRSCCNDSPYHVVIANIPASSPLGPKPHLYLLSIALLIQENRNECGYDEFSAIYWHIYHILSFCVALMIYFIRTFMGCFFSSGKTFRVGEMIHFQFSECVFWDSGVINQQRVNCLNNLSPNSDKAKVLGELSVRSVVVQGNRDRPGAPGFVVSTLAAAFPDR